MIVATVSTVQLMRMNPDDLPNGLTQVPRFTPSLNHEVVGGLEPHDRPLVVSRALALKNRMSFANVALAPLYSMGLFCATKKRMTVSLSKSFKARVKKINQEGNTAACLQAPRELCY